ncbi:DNA-binding transcriptional regulator AraC [compost metagenome]
MRFPLPAISMNDTAQNKIHIEKTMGVFVGQFNDNVSHKHFALQISVASQGKFKITDAKDNQNSYSTCFINSNVLHQFKSNETSLIILINPISSIGHQLYNKYRNIKITSLDEDFEQLVEIFADYLQNDSDFINLTNKINNYFVNFRCECELKNHFEDERIYKAIQYLEQNFDRIVSLKEIANICFLSETRFLHLFKEKTNLNFRRYQLWNKLIKSLPYLKEHSITETAHQFGFTDSSHYSRTFKETFGLTPKFLSSLK